MLSLLNYRTYSISPVKGYISHRNNKKNDYLESVRYWASEWEVYSVQQDTFMNVSTFFNSLCQHLTLIEETFNINYYEKEEQKQGMGLVRADDEKTDENLHVALSLANNMVNFMSHVLYDLQKNDGWKSANNLRGLFAFKTEGRNLTTVIDEERSDKDYIKSLLERMKCEVTYKHLFRTQSACLESGNTEKETIKVSFVLDSDKKIKETGSLKIEVHSIGSFFYSFLSKIMHQAMPNYLLPNSRKSSDYTDYNILLSIICMEILLVVSEKLKKALLFQENENEFFDSKVFRGIMNKIPWDDQVTKSFQDRLAVCVVAFNNFFTFHKKITNAYTKLINRYIDLLDRNWYSYQPAIHLKYLSIY